ncbi:VOC family protein [Actinoplanes sp. HUAS TT8]|uniref:VOC family protein n=1 Tax=Actinoplanes sp. HUAS TT8 TaxID=3447453 RepID=UPI003F52089A
MDGESRFSGLTLQIPVGDVEAGRRFYAGLFEREPDFAPHDDFLEWRVLAGVEVWWQVVGQPDGVRPLGSRIRLRVDDVRAATQRAHARLGVAASPITTLPGVVSFSDFDDPWGNRIGFYQDLVPSDEQPEPGGSAHDERMFEQE